MSKIPKYFLHKMKWEKPHKFMQVEDNFIFTTEKNTLYRLPSRDEVYGGDKSVVIVEDADNVGWNVEYLNPKTKEWCTLKGEDEKSWIFSCSKLSYNTTNEFTEIEYESDYGYIKFDILAWLHKCISTAFSLDEDFYYYKVVKFGEVEYNLDRSIGNNASVKSHNQLHLVCERDGDVYNITEELKRYFSKRKLPTATKEIYENIKTGSMSLGEFEIWVRGDN